MSKLLINPKHLFSSSIYKSFENNELEHHIEQNDLLDSCLILFQYKDQLVHHVKNQSWIIIDRFTDLNQLEKMIKDRNDNIIVVYIKDEETDTPPDNVNIFLLNMYFCSSFKMMVALIKDEFIDYILSSYRSFINLPSKSVNYHSFSNLTFLISKKSKDDMDVWKSMIKSIIPMNEKTVNVIADKYSSAQHLYNVYLDKSISEEEKINLLTHIKIETLKKGDKMIDKEISKAVYDHFMAQ